MRRLIIYGCCLLLLAAALTSATGPKMVSHLLAQCPVARLPASDLNSVASGDTSFARGEQIKVTRREASDWHTLSKCNKPVKPFRFITYNVLTGFQKDPRQADRFVEWAKQQQADVIAFQELSTFTQDTLERLAKRYGHSYAVLHKGNNSPIGITSRYPLTNVKKITDSMHHGCIYAEIKGYHLFVTHLSPFSYEKCVEEMKDILNLAAGIPSREKILIAGDLNSFSPADSLQYRKGRKYGVVQSMLNNGFTDLFNELHPAFESSFPTLKYSAKAKAGPVRIDYVFANAAAGKQVAGAIFIKDHTTDSLSDHYPLQVTFNKK